MPKFPIFNKEMKINTKVDVDQKPIFLIFIACSGIILAYSSLRVPTFRNISKDRAICASQHRFSWFERSFDDVGTPKYAVLTHIGRFFRPAYG